MKFRVTLSGAAVPETVIDVTPGEVSLMGDDEFYELVTEKVDHILGPHSGDYLSDFEPLDTDAYSQWRRMGYPKLPEFESAAS